ncbi:MAG TPA: PrsW family intramembrane metalloprotease [Sediminispirochaeta sp.]|nr:PrsW family intramembrane metalloprotease [Sediminispirochaeta sp.]
MDLLFLNILLALVPSLILLWYFLRWDRARREPKGLIFFAFALGFVAVIPAALLEILIDPLAANYPPVLRLFFRAFIVAGLVEEGTKLFVVRRFIIDKPAFDEIMDGIVYTVSASLGFAFFENLFYSTGEPATLIIRGLTAVPLHALASGIMGYFLGLSKFERPGAWKSGLALAVFIHGLYDFLLFLGGAFAFFVFPLMLWSLRGLSIYQTRAVRADRKAGRS